MYSNNYVITHYFILIFYNNRTLVYLVQQTNYLYIIVLHSSTAGVFHTLYLCNCLAKIPSLIICCVVAISTDFDRAAAAGGVPCCRFMQLRFLSLNVNAVKNHNYQLTYQGVT